MRFLFLILLIVITSCSRIEKRGYMFESSDHELIQEGITSKELLLRAMGSPTLISDFDNDEHWIYYAEDVEHTLFFRPNVVARNIMMVNFDRDHTVKSITRLDLSDDNKNLGFSPHYTKIEEKKTGIFKDIFSNVGQVKAQ